MPVSVSVSHLQSAAAGNWRSVLVSAGIPAERLDGLGHPCPRCGGRDRFAAFDQLDLRGAVHCRHCFTRGSNPAPGNGIATLMWILGLDFPNVLTWLADHLGFSTAGGSYAPQSVFVGPSTTGSSTGATRSRAHAVSADHIARMTNLTTDCMRRISPEHFECLSRRLNVSIESLRSLCIGFSSDHSATTWPMRDELGRIVGIRLRALNGTRKWSISGSRSGLFLSRTHRPEGDRLFVVEGATDLAAALDLGIPSIGRCSCRSGFHQIRGYLQRIGVAKVTMVADNDGPGRSGAIALANDLAKRSIEASVIVPPIGNDLRDSIRAGVKPGDLYGANPIHVAAAQCRPIQLTMDFLVADATSYSAPG